MHANLHEKPLTTDQVTSVVVDGTIAENHWKLVCVAVGHGLLHPNVGSGNPDEMPWREGTFHLAYAFAPHFLLLPRRGKAVSLNSILEPRGPTPKEKELTQTSDPAQLPLFNESEKA